MMLIKAYPILHLFLYILLISNILIHFIYKFNNLVNMTKLNYENFTLFLKVIKNIIIILKLSYFSIIRIRFNNY